ncbi:trypsin-like peptidase domain-containing protein [Streptomyces sp. B1866]|uniref:VMAP-C domain-containing protein n=1 Tax=Streptomyces sp. B1866 TaxID=3075431 RepID=UPI00288E09B8|nr:trypsin-like peptidase domain-containing protein [Streptomyces sp. B1866]MDT3395353.1 trypsin-like peptidase domain-containing protein [Streptomyces sp. B1866]
MAALHWRARVDTATGRTRGAAFLVTATRLLTCAHVVAGLTEARVAFPGAAEDLPATVVWRGPWQATGDPGDLAVLELADPAPVPGPCAFAPLDSLRPTAARQHHELRALGFPYANERSGTHVTLHTSADRVLGGEWQEADVAQAHLRRLDEGFSGAAVYHPVTGEVAGMVTDAVLDDERGGYLGRVLPLATLRRHWPDLDDLLDLDWLPRASRRSLRVLLADAAPPAGRLDLVVRQALRLPPGRSLPRFDSPWEAVRYVAEQAGPAEDRLHRFLRGLGPHLGDADVRTALRDWTRRCLPAPAAPEPPLAPPAASVVVRLEPLTRGASLNLTVDTLVDGDLVGRTGPVRVRPDQVQAKVEKALGARVREIHDMDWMFEFAVPESLLDKPFEDWYAREPGTRPRVLRSVPLVVRHVDRANLRNGVSGLLRKRWRALFEGGATAFQGVDCREKWGPTEFGNWLEGEPSYALVYASSPHPDWLSEALHLGVPVMLWRRGPCPDPGHDHCAPEAFWDTLGDALAGLTPDQLPVGVERLRKEAWSPRRGGEDHCGRRLTLYWDDPDRHSVPPLAMGRA